jgi:hypothetical protein
MNGGNISPNTDAFAGFSICDCPNCHRVYKLYTSANHHPLVYNSAPNPQWSSGYDFRVSIYRTSALSLFIH